MIKMTAALQGNRCLRSNTTDGDYVAMILANIAEGDRRMLQQRQFHLLPVNEFWKQLTYEMEYKGGRSSRSLHQERAALEREQTSDGCSDIVLGMARRSTTMTSILVATYFEQLDGHIPINMAEMFQWFEDNQMHEQAERASQEHLGALFNAAPAIIQPSLVLWRRDLDRRPAPDNLLSQIYDVEGTIRALFETTPTAPMVLATSVVPKEINGGGGLQTLSGSRPPPDTPCRFCGGLHWQNSCPAHPGPNWQRKWHPKCAVCEAAGGFRNVKMKSSSRLSPEQLATYSISKHTTACHELALRDFDRKPRPASSM